MAEGVVEGDGDVGSAEIGRDHTLPTVVVRVGDPAGEEGRACTADDVGSAGFVTPGTPLCAIEGH